ncbi:hypothetical protein, partial [Nocardiopsis alba]|uniref:hypothetical protein n=1 Tax=Nocardiopsis alba TaxID=53437 RepID=UPI003403E919
MGTPETEGLTGRPTSQDIDLDVPEKAERRDTTHVPGDQWPILGQGPHTPVAVLENRERSVRDVPENGTVGHERLTSTRS